MYRYTIHMDNIEIMLHIKSALHAWHHCPGSEWCCLVIQEIKSDKYLKDILRTDIPKNLKRSLEIMWKCTAKTN